MFIRLLSLSILTWGLIGCAATYDPGALIKPTDDMPLVLKSFLTGSLIIDGQREVVLFAGTYHPEYENTGVFSMREI